MISVYVLITASIQEAFSSCKVLFNESDSATLHIPYPRSDEPNPKCPGQELVRFLLLIASNNTF